MIFFEMNLFLVSFLSIKRVDGLVELEYSPLINDGWHDEDTLLYINKTS